MISAGLLPLTSDPDPLAKLNRRPQATPTAAAVGELQRARTCAEQLPNLSEEILDTQRAAFERASPTNEVANAMEPRESR